jgi:hypothetical protein
LLGEGTIATLSAGEWSLPGDQKQESEKPSSRRFVLPAEADLHSLGFRGCFDDLEALCTPAKLPGMIRQGDFEVFAVAGLIISRLGMGRDGAKKYKRE